MSDNPKHLGQLLAENEAMTHDIEELSKINSDLATENVQLRNALVSVKGMTGIISTSDKGIVQAIQSVIDGALEE